MEALLVYQKLATTASGLLAEHASWRSVHIYLAHSARPAASEILRRLVAGGGAYAGNAVELLRELE